MIEAKHELEIEVSRPTMPPLRSEPVASPPMDSAAVAPVVAAVAPPPAAPPAPAAALSPAAEARPGDDIGTALARLGDLRDRALITPEEYAAKRQELLDRL